MILSIANTDLSFLLNDEIIALILYLLLYLTYFFFSGFNITKKFVRRFGESSDNLEKTVYLRRLVGFILLGVIPFLVIVIFFDKSISNYGILFPKGKNAFLWFLFPTILITLIGVFQSSKSIDTSYYPEVRKQTWTRRRTFNNTFYWIIYLLGYEFAIRGMLFFSMLYAYGLWPAIIITSVIYSLIHIFKGAKEAYLAFLLGVLFCLITYYTNSIWIAFLNHLLLAVLNDVKAVKASKTMSFVLKNKS